MSFTDIGALLGISRNTVAKHAAHSGQSSHSPGPRAYRGNLLSDIINDAGSRLEAGEVRASLRDGVAAVKEQNRIADRQFDRTLALKIGLMLTAPRPPDEFRDPEVVAIEGEFRSLLPEGNEPIAAPARQREREGARR